MSKMFQSTPAIAGGRTTKGRDFDDYTQRFQSTPAIAGGRTIFGHRHHINRNLFQSTPAIAGGRTLFSGRHSAIFNCFNPRPPLLAGEPSDIVDMMRCPDVSIHARHCWRANQDQFEQVRLGNVFQSTPAIAGGRTLPGASFRWR